MTVFGRADRLLSQWERNAPPVPPDAPHLLRQLVRRVALGAAAACRLRAEPEGKCPTARGEATKCADALLHALLCRPGERVCYHCDGSGCERCGWRGAVLEGGAK